VLNVFLPAYGPPAPRSCHQGVPPIYWFPSSFFDWSGRCLLALLPSPSPGFLPTMAPFLLSPREHPPSSKHFLSQRVATRTIAPICSFVLVGTAELFAGAVCSTILFRLSFPVPHPKRFGAVSTFILLFLGMSFFLLSAIHPPLDSSLFFFIFSDLLFTQDGRQLAARDLPCFFLFLSCLSRHPSFLDLRGTLGTFPHGLRPLRCLLNFLIFLVV